MLRSICSPRDRPRDLLRLRLVLVAFAAVGLEVFRPRSADLAAFRSFDLDEEALGDLGSGEAADCDRRKEPRKNPPNLEPLGLLLGVDERFMLGEERVPCTCRVERSRRVPRRFNSSLRK